MRKSHGQHWSPAIAIAGLSAAATLWLPRYPLPTQHAKAAAYNKLKSFCTNSNACRACMA